MEKVLQQKQAKGAKSNVCFCTGNLTVYIFFSSSLFSQTEPIIPAALAEMALKLLLHLGMTIIHSRTNATLWGKYPALLESAELPGLPFASANSSW